MAIFLPVAPIQLLQSSKMQAASNNNCFYLAHEVVKKPSEYIQNSYNYSHSILDNSAIELGSAVDVSMIAEAAQITNARLIVLPDVLEKSEETVDSTLSAYNEWAQRFGADKLLFIPQGETLKAWIACFEHVMTYTKGKVPWVGIPRNTTNRIVPSRKQLVDIVKAMHPFIRIHLMGFSDYLWDDIVTAKDPRVSSIDSAMPLRLNDHFRMTSDPGKRDPSWWDKVEFRDIQASNVLNVNLLVKAW